MGFKKINQFWLIKNGVMSGTTALISPSQQVQNFDNIGLEVSWTGTPTGAITINGSISAVIPTATANFYSLTFNPALAQPSGSAGGYIIDLNNFPFPAVEVQYVNQMGNGILNVFLFSKDMN